MLVELSVRDMGVIGDLRLVLEPGMTALTGETGAGKTLVVQAIQLLTGSRADASLVRPGAAEAVIEGRFVRGDDEVVVSRVIAAKGRSRAYVDGRMANSANLSHIGSELVDLHGQHAHQSLLSPVVQRAALDDHADIDLAALGEARGKVRAVLTRLEEVGGDTRARAHEIDLLRYQIAEIEDAAIESAAEESNLEAEEDLLADAHAHLDAAGGVREAIAGDGGALDKVGHALSLVTGRGPFRIIETRLRALQGEIDDVTSEVRSVGDSIEDNPDRLRAVGVRRQQLRDLTRKYGDSLGEVLAFAKSATERLDQLERYDELADELEQALAGARTSVAAEAKLVAEARRAAADPLGRAITDLLPDLAMARAQVHVSVSGPDPCDDIEFLFTANSGSDPLPLSKVASGGELARVMLALRLVLSTGPETLVFDEVDAGIGGEAAVAVGASLAKLGAEHQVLVVTHLPQVAAFADEHVVVTKTDDGSGAKSQATPARGEGRVVELARMLAGRPDSIAGREHAAELLAMGAEIRARRS
ncbi:MAG: DNA repair protein RecN [Actinomycetia bacterium]|nr:DNA repair protein RecN [Actinomycetes bacterium]MCP4962965.1 DNA repair protein RecN [Actinomycetes bacterium]